jgi:hypothetical protein
MIALCRACPCIFAALVVVSAGSIAGADVQAGKSGPLAKELVQLMDKASTTFAAAKDPSEPDRFVAAMHLAGTQLIVISAKYSAPQLLDQALAEKKYQDVYLDLNSASTPGSREFVEDVGVNGLVANPEENTPVDSFEAGTKKTALTGDWKKLKITEEAYKEAYDQADTKYAAMLNLLIAQLKK